MGLTNSIYTALTGLNASQQRLDVTGNNIANVNTVAFKGSRAVFQTQLYQTMSNGSQPTLTSGGINPMQLGTGTATGAIQKDMTNGSIDTTGINTDMAIRGNGMFVLQTVTGETVYSRDGSFSLDANQDLTNVDGSYVMGYPIDSGFNIVSGTPTKLSVPVGKLTIAQTTENTVFKGNLNAAQNPATTPGTSVSEALADMSTAAPATVATLLTNVATANNPGGTFDAGDIITLNATKGGRDLPASTFTVQAGSTVADLTDWIQTTTGIDPTAPQATAAGVTIDATGQINVISNVGTDNDLSVALANSGVVSNPMVWTDTPTDPAANVGSQATSFLVYDTLGNAATVDVTMVMESKTSAGTTWRFYVSSPDNTNPSPFLGTGTITFDTNGRYAGATGTDIVLNHANAGAVDPIAFSMDFSDLGGIAANSSVVMNSQDGYGAGTLNDFAVGADGIITGSFSNGLSRPLGQVVVANFANPQGLVADADNIYRVGPDSGEPNITTAGNLGTGSIVGGALELSNVDITKEFINMVTATTAFSAAGKVITTSNQLLGDLLQILR